MRLISDEAVLESYIVEKGLAKAGDGHKFYYCSGGVSGTVAYLERSGDAPLIIKQALEYLKVKEEWPCPPDRVVIEYNANKVYAEVAKDNVPAPLFVDEENWVFVRQAVHGIQRRRLVAAATHAGGLATCNSFIDELY